MPCSVDSYDEKGFLCSFVSATFTFKALSKILGAGFLKVFLHPSADNLFGTLF